MPDLSKLDSKYFIDTHVYNCPFCSRRNVLYNVTGRTKFDWTESKQCFVYIVKCSSCFKESMHLSFMEIGLKSTGHYFRFDIESALTKSLDDLFFYSVPNAFFVMDERIPKILRELFDEAEGCLKGNFLTGASACARKLVYELAILEKATGDNYDSRLKSLKSGGLTLIPRTLTHF